MLNVDEARARVLALLEALPTEDVPLDQAVGRGLAAVVMARRTLPPWDNSAMDGFAVCSKDLRQPPARLKILETIVAGARPTLAITSGTCAKIMTGAPMPQGADAVVPVERSRVFGDDVELDDSPRPGTFVRARGEDALVGEVLLAEGSPLGIPEAALLWAQGITHARVPRRPRVGILSTGDELCDVTNLSDDKLVDTNGPALALAVERAGGIPVRLGIARDVREDVVAALSRAGDFDIILTSAGVSMGERDVVKDALAELGVEMAFWKVAVKPGKPLAVGKRGSTVFFGLPGNPTSSLVSFELFVRPALRRMLGHARVEPLRIPAKSSQRLTKTAGLTHLVRVTAESRTDGLWATPLTTQTSGALRSAALATHLLIFPSEATELSPGSPVELLTASWAAA
jgi:molybdopterin molybdotransferase